MLLIAASSPAYIAENQAHPEKFGSIPAAMTTVGYGDVVPVTPWGKLLAGAIGVIGIGMVALPAGLLASGFSGQLHQRRREFEAAVERIPASGAIGPDEGHEIRAFRERLGLSDRQAAEIVRFMMRQRRSARCPHCGKPPGSAHPGDAAGRHGAYPLHAQFDLSVGIGRPPGKREPSCWACLIGARTR